LRLKNRPVAGINNDIFIIGNIGNCPQFERFRFNPGRS